MRGLKLAEGIRIVKGDSRVLQFKALDKDTGLYIEQSVLDEYDVLFDAEDFSKTTVNQPTEIRKDVDGDGNPIILIELKSSETNPSGKSLLHYTLTLYKAADVTIKITGSTGDLIFVDEK